MPDRNLREQSQALPGRFGAIEARLRALSVRTWPGAMRTGGENLYNPVDPSTFNTLIEVVTLPGRWLAMGQFDLSCPNPSGDADFEFRLAAFDSEDGTQQTGPAFDFPIYYFQTASTTAVRFPVTLIGDFANEGDDNLNVTMQCRETNGRTWTVTNIRLKLIPR